MSPEKKRAMICRDDRHLSISQQCKLVRLSRSAFYDTPVGIDAATLSMMKEIDRVFTKYPFFGSRQISAYLRREGIAPQRHERGSSRVRRGCPSFETCPVRKRALQLIQSIKGIGPVAATTILIEMPEIGRLRKKAVASLAGVAPITRQSGRWRGQSFIQGGRKPLRDALDMPAIVATQYNPDLKARYKRMKAAGKPSKVVLTAIMRKLLIMANTLVKVEDREWVEIRA